MKATQMMIAWNPISRGGNGHEIEVGPWPDETGWSRKYICTRPAPANPHGTSLKMRCWSRGQISN